MKTYWDYSERERGKLTKEEVESLLDVELMTKGVKKVIEPVLKTIQEVSIASEILFEVDGVYFKDADMAQKFLTLNPRKAAYDYSCGYDYHYTEPFKPLIAQKTLYSRQAVLDLKLILKQNAQAKQENEKMLDIYKKNSDEQNEILNGVWEDWWRCISRVAELQAIIDTKAVYVKMTNGDEKLALEFLAKIYSAEDIKEAFEVKET